jgi:hypothetical protein
MVDKSGVKSLDQYWNTNYMNEEVKPVLQTSTTYQNVTFFQSSLIQEKELHVFTSKIYYIKLAFISYEHIYP